VDAGMARPGAMCSVLMGRTGTLSATPMFAQPGARSMTWLRMLYHTVTHASFLLQGRADAYTAGTPSERTEG
jgi:hypothetical protein